MKNFYSKKCVLKKFGFSESIYNSFLDTVFITQSMIRGIIKLFSGNAQKGEIGGPVRIAELSGQAFVSGLVPLVFFWSTYFFEPCPSKSFTNPCFRWWPHNSVYN